MHRLIPILLVLIGILLHTERPTNKIESDKVYNYTIQELWDNESTMSFIADSLNRPPFREAMIKVKFGPLHPRIGGLTTEIVDGVYFIQMNPRYDLATAQRTFFHELVHVYQFRMNWLIERQTDVLWKGQVWSWKVPWILRPWELQAEAYTNELFCTELDK